MKNNLWLMVKKHRTIIMIFFLGLLLRLILSVQIYSGDVNNHVAWAKDALRFGFAGIYQRSFEKYGVMTPTYPPIPLYFFTFFYWLFRFIYQLAWKLNNSYSFFPSKIIWLLEDQDTLPAFLKIPAIFADFGIAYVVFLFSKKILGKKAGFWPILSASLVLFNPAFFYNSAYWGQIEAVPLFFILASFYFLLFSRRYISSVISFTLALLTKQSSIIFIPLFALGYWFKFGIKKITIGLLFFLLVFYVFFLPFFKQGSFLSFPVETYINKIQTGSGSDYVTDHAFNFWAVVSGLGKIPDSKPFLFGLSYSVWGYGLFGALYALIIYILIKTKVKVKNFIFSASLIPFSAFLFLTRMHERYLEPALPFLLLISLEKKKSFPAFLIISFIYLVNLYHNWWAPEFAFTKNIFIQARVVNFLIFVEIGIFLYILVRYISSSGNHD